MCSETGYQKRLQAAGTSWNQLDPLWLHNMSQGQEPASKTESEVQRAGDLR